MNMPGFTAEASFYRTSGHYQSIVTRAYSDGGQTVVAQLRIDPFRVSRGGGVFGDVGDWLGALHPKARRAPLTVLFAMKIIKHV